MLNTLFKLAVIFIGAVIALKLIALTLIFTL
jgi:hypothetical protein